MSTDDTVLSKSCYGFDAMPGDEMCKSCPGFVKCLETSEAFRERESLAQALTRLLKKDLRQVYRDVRGDTIAQVYSRLQHRHFGRRLQRTETWMGKHEKVLERMIDYCSENDIEIAAWINAQMHGMKKFVMETGMPFRANMLSPTEKAQNRYRIYIELSNRTRKRGRADAYDSETPMGEKVHDLFSSEEDVALTFVNGVLSDMPLTWSEAIKESDPSELWMSVERSSRWELEVAKEIARVHAACAITEKYQLGLSERIGYKQDEFTWAGLAATMKRILVREWDALGEGDIEEVAGFLWRPNEVRPDTDE